MNNGKKVVVITGASQGIGAALVSAYLDRNYRVVATSRSIQPSNNPDVLAIAGDIGDPATGPRVIAEAIERFGRIDTLVNNAGIFLAGPFTELQRAAICRRRVDQHQRLYYITQAAIAAMEKQGRGHVVSITTSLADHALSQVPSVLAALSKGGINAASKSLAVEYATRGIRVNTVSPGVIKTPMHAPETHAFLAALHPVGRMGDISDIVDAVLYLDNAGFVTAKSSMSMAASRRVIDRTIKETKNAHRNRTGHQGRHRGRRRSCDRRTKSSHLSGHEPGPVRRAQKAARMDLGHLPGSRDGGLGLGAECPLPNIARRSPVPRVKARPDAFAIPAINCRWRVLLRCGPAPRRALDAMSSRQKPLFSKRKARGRNHGSARCHAGHSGSGRRR